MRDFIAKTPDFIEKFLYRIILYTNVVIWSRSIVNCQFLKISYAGDCARVYADGKLVMDNFWNGKPMLVRMSDLANKKVELRILPLSKDAPIYLQKEQREKLNNSPTPLLQLNSINLLTVISTTR